MPKETHTPAYLWNTLHIEQSNSAKAAELAAQELIILDTHGFSNLEISRDFTEYARIAVVTGLAAARDATSWHDLITHLERTIELVINTYPLVSAEDELSFRAVFWSTAFGGDSYKLICLRDVLHLAQFLSIVYADDDVLVGEVNSFLEYLHEVIMLLIKSDDSDEGKTAGLIYQIEDATYPQAKAAFDAFVLIPDQQPDRVITVVSRMLGRATDEQDEATVELCRSLIVKKIEKYDDLTTFAQDQIEKNLSSVDKRQKTKQKIYTMQINSDASGKETLETTQKLLALKS